ncbi:hypothetical protein ADL26_19250, partial [Thermoactinomyces vulgaris]
MADQPEPYKKPQYSTKLASWAVVAGAFAAIAAVLLVSSDPPSPYSNLLAAAVASAVVIAVGLFLTGLVLLIAEAFRRRHARTEQSIKDYQEATTARLDELSDQQRLLIAMVCVHTSSARAIYRDQTVLRNRVQRWQGEVSILAEALSELREIFVEQGLPEQRERLRQRGAGPAPAPLYSITMRAATRSASNRLLRDSAGSNVIDFVNAFTNSRW